MSQPQRQTTATATLFCLINTSMKTAPFYTLSLLAAISTLIILLNLCRTYITTHDAILDALLNSASQLGQPVPQPALLTSIDQPSINTLYRFSHPPKPHYPIIKTLQSLLKCPPHNNTTKTFQLNATIQNITMHADEASAQYFNPTLIPLPPWEPTPYSAAAHYLLVSRLVTRGLHQESHACLATFCHDDAEPSITSTTQDSVPCSSLPETPSSAGLHCLHAPRPLNIPPTPSRHCDGPWAAFPAIPGFHDPRVTWSGRGEPLIVLNSASAYGCVGLWVMDLRGIVPEFRDVLEARAMGVTGGDVRAVANGKKQATGSRSKGWWRLPVLRYQYLTELTRWSGRADVEKNWVLWWPGDEGEARISYEAFGRRVDDEFRTAADGETLPIQLSPHAAMNLSSADPVQSLSLSLASPIPSPWWSWPAHNTSAQPFTNASSSTSTSTPSTNSTNPTAESKPARRAIPTTRQSPSSRQRKHHHHHHHHRTTAHLLSSGLTSPPTPNARTRACIPPNDSAGRAHFHQSTPALRLLLYHRRHHGHSHSHPQHETSDLEVHISLIQRKLSNAWGIPVAYERFVALWAPDGTMLGMSAMPLGFRDEEKRSGFRYVVSLAWAWRARHLFPREAAEGGIGNDEDESEILGWLGTGYLDDQVVLGVGVDDVAQVVVRVGVAELLGCLVLCEDSESDLDVDLGQNGDGDGEDEGTV
jgi:hypothetical protein